MDQLTYDLRHLKTGFNNYKHRKMMKVLMEKLMNKYFLQTKPCLKSNPFQIPVLPPLLPSYSVNKAIIPLKQKLISKQPKFLVTNVDLSPPPWGAGEGSSLGILGMLFGHIYVI